MTLINKLTVAFAVVLFAMLAVAPLPAEGQGSLEGDRAALEALYDATDGPNWHRNDYWKTDRPLIYWYGVITIGGRVVNLGLERNNLSGELPPALGDLTNLESLWAEDNNLTGGIPRELGRLTGLSRLSLDGNNLTGGIPRELGNLTRLQNLYLDGNNLTGGIPRELGNLTSLEWLFLNDNDLTGRIPSELGRLTGLEWLDLSSNSLNGGIPGNLGDLQNLFRLALQRNNLTGEIPRELTRIATLPGLQLLLSLNRLTGTIPYELGRFEETINPQQNDVILPIDTAVPALPFVGALLLACGLYVMGRRKMLRLLALTLALAFVQTSPAIAQTSPNPANRAELERLENRGRRNRIWGGMALAVGGVALARLGEGLRCTG